MITRGDVDWRLVEMSEKLRDSNRSLSKALAAAQDIASHAMSLQEVTAALSQAQTEKDVADVVLGQGLDVAGGVRGVLARVHGERLEMIRASEHQLESETPAVCLSLDIDCPITEAVRSNQPLWLETPDEHRARFPLLYERAGNDAPRASVAVPLRHGDETLGALAIFFADSAAFCAAKQAFTLLLAQASADALFRARSYDAERLARHGAETLARARADVLGIVAHDLRNPLSLISSTSSMLLDCDDMPQAKRRNMLEIAQRAVRRMDRLIGDLLDAMQLQAGRLSLDLADIDARKTIREAEGAFSASAAERRIELRSHTPEYSCCVRADEGRLIQVLGNLIANAIKFTAEGGSVNVSVCRAESEVVFCVSDNGSGIPEEHRGHLFDSFWQARHGDRRGVGLGLSITKDIVHALDGRIWVESTVGVGTSISIALPATADLADVPRADRVNVDRTWAREAVA